MIDKDTLAANVTRSLCTRHGARMPTVGTYTLIDSEVERFLELCSPLAEAALAAFPDAQAAYRFMADHIALSMEGIYSPAFAHTGTPEEEFIDACFSFNWRGGGFWRLNSGNLDVI